jgi:hypothetical protein
MARAKFQINLKTVMIIFKLVECNYESGESQEPGAPSQ